jgi:DNA-binding transcriptional regulator YiaG
MITNERQYRITKGALKKIEASIAAHDAGQPSPDVHPRIYQAMGDALRSEAEALQGQLREYDRLRAGRVKQRTLRSLNELPKAIIEARIAARITQKGLADRLGVAEQQVQRWEATKYAGVSVERRASSVERLQEVADALGAKVTEKVQFRAARNSDRAAARPSGARPGARRGSTTAL